MLPYGACFHFIGLSRCKTLAAQLENVTVRCLFSFYQPISLLHKWNKVTEKLFKSSSCLVAKVVIDYGKNMHV